MDDKIGKLLLEAEILSGTDNLYKQIQLYKQVLELDKNNISALINISDRLIKMNLSREAKEYANRAYLLHKAKDDMATVNYSCILIDCKDYAKAIKILEKDIFCRHQECFSGEQEKQIHLFFLSS